MTEEKPKHSAEFILALQYLLERGQWSAKTLAKRANELADGDHVGFQVTYAMQVHRVSKGDAMLVGTKGARTLHYWARAMRLTEEQEQTLLIAAGIPLEDQQRKASQELLRWTSGELPIPDPDTAQARILGPTTDGDLQLTAHQKRRLLAAGVPISVEAGGEHRWDKKEGRWKNG